MKQYGLLGKGTGKLGSSVFAISGGEQIVREYNPKVSNPNTSLQVEQRAKFKLMSQLAALLAPILGFNKIGLVSARNGFVKANIRNAEYDGTDYAHIPMTALNLTPSSVIANGVNVIFDSENDRGQITLDENARQNYDAIVFGVATEQGESYVLRSYGFVPVSDLGQNENINVSLGDGDNFVYAYAIKYAGVNGTLYYHDLTSDGVPDEAAVEVVRAMVKSGATFTKSKALKMTI